MSRPSSRPAARTARLLFLLALVLALCGAAGAQAQSVAPFQHLRPPASVADGALHLAGPAAEGSAAVASSRLKLDAAARLLAAQPDGVGKSAARASWTASLPLSVHATAATVDVFVRLRPGASAAALGAVGAVTTGRVGDVVTARVPVRALDRLAALPAVDFVETSRRRPGLNDAGRVDIGADQVHQGADLPRAFRGAGVVVGVIDSGIDVTHPAFSDAGGTRIQHLLEYTQQGGETTWTKAQIDADPGAVTQRDGDGGFGHGTHVAGTAAGGPGTDAAFTGIAPEADIVFVKGIRHPDSNGGFADVDVVNGTQFIFDRAAEMGRPAVVNLSLGSNFGPLDGTSLYEQALSGLTGPGRIIVAAAGNEGFASLHAGTVAQAQAVHQTLLLANAPDLVRAQWWYAPGAVSRVAVAMYGVNEQNQLVTLGQTDPVDVGQVLGVDAQGNLAPVPLTAQGDTLGYLYVDAATTEDPRNGDGNVFLAILANGDPDVDVSATVWGLVYTGTTTGRVDLWAGGGSFFGRALGFEGVTEVPGDNVSSVGSPSTARRVISVGSYTTRNEWVDVDGTARQLQVPDGQGGVRVPALQDISYFSSRGPTRDGRIAPDLAAPGERIASARSRHLTEGVGIVRSDVLPGGDYRLMQGTSMASPHVAGVVALMLEADPTLDYDDAVRILRQTARADAQTGTVPNQDFGAGRLDAWAAVDQTVREAGGTRAVAVLDVEDVAVGARPGETGEAAFTLRNTGGAELTFTLTPGPVTARQPAGATLSNVIVGAPPAAAAARTGPTPLLALGRATGTGHAAAPASDVVLFVDDGNQTADDYLGYNDGVTDLQWRNLFFAGDEPFQLESIAFHMRTGTATANPVDLAVYDVAGAQLAGGSLTFDLAPTGDWFGATLDPPLQFAASDTFVVEVVTSGVIDYAAGTDAQATALGRSTFFDTGTGTFVSLATVEGFEQGAFLIRALGSRPPVENQPPNAVAALSDSQAVVGEAVTFDASASNDPDGEITSYAWQFGDGATSGQAVAQHTFAAAGTYTATLTVTDDRGATGTATARVTVTDAAPMRLTAEPASGTVAPGGTQTITLRLDAADLAEGSYESHLEIVTNGGDHMLPVRVQVDQTVDAATEYRPAAFRLDPAFPNPFRAATEIRYRLPTAAQVTLAVYDVYGRRVAVLDEGRRGTGTHRVRWTGDDARGAPVAAGLYLYRLDVADGQGRTVTHTGRTVRLR